MHKKIPDHFREYYKSVELQLSARHRFMGNNWPRTDATACQPATLYEMCTNIYYYYSVIPQKNNDDSRRTGPTLIGLGQLHTCHGNSPKLACPEPGITPVLGTVCSIPQATSVGVVVPVQQYSCPAGHWAV